MSGVAGWWRGLSGPGKFRFYTRISLQVGLAAVVVSIVASDAGLREAGGFWPSAGVVVAGLAAAVAVESQPDLTSWTDWSWRRGALWVAGGVLVAVWSVAAAANLASGTDDATTAGVAAAIFGAIAVVAFAPRVWWWLAGISSASGLALGARSGDLVPITLGVAAGGAFAVGLVLLTVWSLRMVEDLERTKDVEAELRVAEERLRFARDMHDVVGRNFSAIAVKSELAATLAGAGATERAAAEMIEVKTVAVESMEQMRSIVRGYRDIDLGSEVAGAQSLLSASGCRLEVEGDPAGVPVQFHEVAAWVVREGTTNIVKHSTARSATLTLGGAGMTLRNDGARHDPGEHSGLRGLAERLGAGGSTLHTHGDGETFTLEVVWSAA